jgi:hypothetical protein
MSQAEWNIGLDSNTTPLHLASGFLHAQHKDLQRAGLQEIHLSNLPAHQYSGHLPHCAGFR